MIRMSALALTGLAASLVAPAEAQLRDVMAADRDGAAHLWLAFGTQPRSAVLEGGALHVTGVSDAARAITPAGPAPFSALSVTPDADGLRLELSGAGWIRAEVRQGGVWVQLDAPAGYSAPAPHLTARAPDPASGPSPAEREEAHASIPDPSARTDPALPDPSAQPPASTPAVPPSRTALAAATACAASAQALEDAPWDMDMMIAHGACLAEAGDGSGGAELFERVLAFEPDHASAALGLARIKEARGEHARAAELYEAAARGSRTDGEALAAMAAAQRLRERAGD
ncbi:hypothetical protein F1654_03165 [Alkalicaulis satelles]|uniref:Uncharacterized protein n=1 Tax=Alkalicaulis satelles TaxID=2609175 RepID=A0A5M6ZL21_9PROT|nr:tetratricopeptide repeat protein [Alkalicaulis satelles]KAA5805010.1 hypothetical protein F1654_03165 [Alkalicaulis satelles]